MPTLTINGISFVGVPQGYTAGKLTQGNYYATGGELGPPPCVYPIECDDRPKSFTGQDGTYEVRHGKRFRPITVTLVIAGSLSYVGPQAVSLLDGFMQLNRYQITTPYGDTYDGCKLKSYSPFAWKTIDALTVLSMPLTFHQLSFPTSGG